MLSIPIHLLNVDDEQCFAYSLKHFRIKGSLEERPGVAKAMLIPWKGNWINFVWLLPFLETLHHKHVLELNSSTK